MGFFKNLLRVYTARIGNASGSDFNRCYVATAKKDGLPALLIWGFGKKDYVFNKNDIKEANLISGGAGYNFGGQIRVANKYRIVFNDGKSVILDIPVASSSKIERIIY